MRPIAEPAGHFRQRERARHLDLADYLIAATAVPEAAPLATGNTPGYPMPELALLPARG